MNVYAKLLSYEAWANAQVIESLRATANPPEKALHLLAHLASARKIWYTRIATSLSLEGAIQGYKATPAELFPAWNLAQSSGCLETFQPLLERVSGLPAIEETTIVYHTTEGSEKRSIVSDILLHLVNHGTYHRAQIASELVAHKNRPAVSDYIFYVRT